MTIYLENTKGEPIYVMSPSVQAFIQVGMAGRSPLTPVAEATASVLK